LHLRREGGGPRKIGCGCLGHGFQNSDSFDEAIEHARALGTGSLALISDGAPSIALSGLRVALPDGRQIVDTGRLALSPRESVLVAGPSGSRKSTLLRAIAGIWPFAEGRIQLPEHARVMMVLQRPYIPIGTLRAGIAYPAAPHAYPDAEVRMALVPPSGSCDSALREGTKVV
jgi:putative ATP-binding cassette transporter